MSNNLIHLLSDGLLYFMQASILIPMAVVWRRRGQFPPAVKLLSWYVYLSAGCVGLAMLYPAYLPNNYGVLVGFNLGKMALLGAVYFQVLPAGPMRRVVLFSTVSCIIGVCPVIGYDLQIAVFVARVTQCALLAALALVYMEHTLGRPAGRSLFQDPLWLLSVGQLFYSAGTISAFSFNFLSRNSLFDVSTKFIFVSISGLVFNWFLTLAFLRAGRNPSTVAETANAPVREFARF